MKKIIFLLTTSLSFSQAFATIESEITSNGSNHQSTTSEKRNEHRIKTSWEKRQDLRDAIKALLGEAPSKSNDEKSKEVYRDLWEAENLWASDGTISTQISVTLRKAQMATELPNYKEQAYWSAYYYFMANHLIQHGLEGIERLPQ